MVPKLYLKSGNGSKTYLESENVSKTVSRIVYLFKFGVKPDRDLSSAE